MQRTGRVWRVDEGVEERPEWMERAKRRGEDGERRKGIEGGRSGKETKWVEKTAGENDGGAESSE